MDSKVILVMGSVGSKKANLIRRFAKCTDNTPFLLAPPLLTATLYGKVHNNQAIVVVDTPEWDDVDGDNVNTLKATADFLIRCYRANIQITGIVYVTGPENDYQSLPTRMFLEVCGVHWAPNMVIIPQPQDEEDDALGYYSHSVQETQLDILRDAHPDWTGTVQNGAWLMRDDGSVQSASAIFNKICGGYPQNKLFNIQSDYSDGDTMLFHTSAALALHARLVEDSRRRAANLQTFEAQLPANPDENSSRWLKSLKHDLQYVKSQIKDLATTPYGRDFDEEMVARDRYFGELASVYDERIRKTEHWFLSDAYMNLQDVEMKRSLYADYEQLEAMKAVHDVAGKLAAAFY